VRLGEPRHSLLQAIARTVSQSLGFGTVVINLYRPAWDDFRVEAIHGDEKALESLVGDVRGWDVWRPLLDPAFERRGAYFVPHGQFNWESHAPNAYIPDMPESEEAGAWHPEDMLAAPMRHSDGHLLGVLVVDEPAHGQVPSDDEIDVLVAFAAHAALALQSADEAEAAARHHAALEELLGVSRRLTETFAIDEILRSVCEGISSTLSFRCVAIDLRDADEVLRARAAVGWEFDSPPVSTPIQLPELAAIMLDEFETEGCYLLTSEQAEALLDPVHWTYHSELSGRGPNAWNDHWLFVPVRDRGGELVGVIWVDDPVDRRLPTRTRLQALRIFANQAAAALDAAAQFEEVRFLADHDPLTKLLNRRVFSEQLGVETARSERYGRPFSLIMCDLDGFKHLNDTRGHLAGDRALAAFAQLLLDGRREVDAVFRIGGDEFAVLLPEVPGDEAQAVVARIREQLAAIQEGPLAGLSASFGVASHPDHGQDPDELFRAADDALYEDKRPGRGTAHAPSR
jgi:diguanylate cyclase (GGDEF)-like protein